MWRTVGSSARISPTTSLRSKSLPPWRYPSTASTTFGAICAKRSITLRAPNSGAALEKIAPTLAVARNAISVSGMFGM